MMRESGCNGVVERIYARVGGNGCGQYEPDIWWSILGVMDMNMGRKMVVG